MSHKSLITGGSDPFLPELIDAINQATEIKIVVAFIRMTGLDLIFDALNDALESNAKVHIITGDYLNVTEPLALKSLMLLKERGATVSIFETSGTTSFHMKSYIFTNSTDIAKDIAFVGSSNISKAALTTGLEWNFKVLKKQNELAFNELLSSFRKLTEDQRVVELTYSWIEKYALKYDAAKPPRAQNDEFTEVLNSPEPNKIQQEALQKLSQTREKLYKRGLVVLATGMGKTWLAAFDAKAVNAKRILFVAHREEILAQAEKTFLLIFPQSNTGQYNGNIKQAEADIVFASVQTLGRERHLNNFTESHFDYIVVDEFHHASAKTYQNLLSHFNPRFMLGLTATPERTDQSDILSLCDDNLVYQKDLFDGINEEILSPFSYFGVADVVDYTEIPWRSGKFEPNSLLNKLATTSRANHVYKKWLELKQTRTLAFCISQQHADFMAEFFVMRGVNAISVHSGSVVRRNEAINDLVAGRVEIIFSVDLFNEGVDVPAIDTVLMLRPTESKIVFLQQLGRGLRKSNETDKQSLIVIDFIGNHISFFKKLEALFSESNATNKKRRELLDRVEAQRLELPPGCFVNFDLESIDFLKRFVTSKIDTQVSIYQSLKESYGRRPTLPEFYNGAGSLMATRNESGSWFEFVSQQGDLSSIETDILSRYSGFLRELETTSLTKSFKLILLEAFIALDGFRAPVAIDQLAKKSLAVIHRRRQLVSELPNEFQNENLINQSAWQKYWLKNPISAWVGRNAKHGPKYFTFNESQFGFESIIDKSLLNNFCLMVEEILHYRYAAYECRMTTTNQSGSSKPPIVNPSGEEIPFFSDLKIACGHFSSSEHSLENLDFITIPPEYGKLDSSKHFVAVARGNSMNGGKHPIHSGDYLLLERITSNNAGSNNGKIVAIERQDQSGDDQYLLRRVHKNKQGQYELVAQNPDYSNIIATDDMRTLARLKATIKPIELALHRSFYRESIPELFGLEFNTGLWQSGHVCPKERDDQVLLVTLNKSGKQAEHRYHDYFIDEAHFNWQSQNSTAPSGKRGQQIINHEKLGSSVHLFVRKNKLEAKKAAPFIYCGKVIYQSHESEKPMNVKWCLETPLPKEILEYFS